jgi:hypothetical protein
MDPCWKNLPTDLVDYICGTWLPRLRGVSLHFQNELKNYISQRDFYSLLDNYTNLFGPYRAIDVFCDDMYNLLNDHHEECQYPFLAVNAWNPEALWAAMDSEKRHVLLIEA